MKTGITVAEAMTSSPITIDPEINITDCSKLMREKHVGGILVTYGNALQGIITEQDIVRKVIAEGLDPSTTRISQVMETNMTTIPPDVDLAEALDKMGQLNIRHLPVVLHEELVGIITIKDILKIQPELFEVIVEQFEIRDEQRKLALFSKVDKDSLIEGNCESCGEYSDSLIDSEGQLLCPDCSKSN